MGWLSWLRFGCTIDCETKPMECISENLFKRTADLMVSEGYLAAGYNYITIDDCWLEKDRGPDGRLVPDRKRFPNGMKALAAYVACSWPYFLEVNHIQANYSAVAEHCNVWRFWVDIRNSWSSVVSTMNWAASNQHRLAPFAGPGHWNDPDMLVIGNSGLTVEQAKVQMAIWAIMAAPLHMSVDLATIQPEFRAILLNREIIAVNQDKLGKQGLRVWKHRLSWRHKFQIWKRDLSDDCYAIAIVYLGHETNIRVFFTYEEMKIPRQNYFLHDLYNMDNDRTLNANENLTVKMNGTSVTFYKFIPKNFTPRVEQI